MLEKSRLSFLIPHVAGSNSSIAPLNPHSFDEHLAFSLPEGNRRLLHIGQDSFKGFVLTANLQSG